MSKDNQQVTVTFVVPPYDLSADLRMLVLDLQKEQARIRRAADDLYWENSRLRKELRWWENQYGGASHYNPAWPGNPGEDR